MAKLARKRKKKLETHPLSSTSLLAPIQKQKQQLQRPRGRAVHSRAQVRRRGGKRRASNRVEFCFFSFSFSFLSQPRPH